MSEKLTVHDPRGFPPKVTGKRLAPRPVVRKIQSDSVRALNMPDLRARILELGNQPVGSTPEEFDAFVAADMKKWAKLIRDAGIPLE